MSLKKKNPSIIGSQSNQKINWNSQSPQAQEYSHNVRLLLWLEKYLHHDGIFNWGRSLWPSKKEREICRKNCQKFYKANAECICLPSISEYHTSWSQTIKYHGFWLRCLKTKWLWMVYKINLKSKKNILRHNGVFLSWNNYVSTFW